MKNYLIAIACLLMLSFTTANADDFESATEAVRNIGVGWNLGNTLDANKQTETNVLLTSYWGQQGLESENYWGQPTTKPELMHMMKEAGFGAIRVPVTWYNHMDINGNVDATWMARVHEVVDYVIDAGMYCIINVHHDTGADSYDANGNMTGRHWIHADENNYNENKTRYENLWRQIALEFKDYGERLLFESYNEMLDSENSWCFASFASTSNYNANIAASAYSAINKYAQSFVDVVRATGGNNAKRNLIVNTYAACSGGGTWNSHLKDPLKEMKMPQGESNHIIFEIHSYPNIANLSNAKSEVNDMFNAINQYLVAKGAPVIFGEWGTSNVDNGSDYLDNHDNMIEFLKYFVKKAKENNFATFYWMGLTDGANRDLPAFNQADLAETIVKAYHGDDYQGLWPDVNKLELEYTVTYNGEWQELNLYSGSTLKLADYKGIRLEMIEEPAPNSLQIKVYGETSGSNTKTYTYPLASGTKQTTVMFNSSHTGSSFDRITLQTRIGATEAKISKAVLIRNDNTEIETHISVFWGCSLTYRIAGSTGIRAIDQPGSNSDYHIYNLAGQRVDKPQKGNLYIKNGKKYIAR